MKKIILITLLTLTPIFTFASIDKDLKFGMKNNSVKDMQQILFNKGYLDKSSVTGLFGNITLRAVKNYQSDNKIVSTGLVGPLTRGLMNKSKVISTTTVAVVTPSVTKIPVIEPPVPVQISEKIVEVKKDSVDYDSLVDFASMDDTKVNEYAWNATKDTNLSYKFLFKFLKTVSPSKSKCYLTDSPKGLLSNGVGVMKPNRDLQPFFKITNDLGVDPYKVAVSCDYGLIGGGFSPATWVSTNIAVNPNQYDTSKQLNPWNPQDVALLYVKYSSLSKNPESALCSAFPSHRNGGCAFYHNDNPYFGQ